MAKKEQSTHVQVIMRKSQELSADQEAWNETEKLCKDILNRSIEIQVLLEEMGPKLREITDKIHKAYNLAPKKDCLLGTSPMSQVKVNFALKSYMTKVGFDAGVKVIDLTKVQSFKDYMNDATKWLLKLKS